MKTFKSFQIDKDSQERKKLIDELIKKMKRVGIQPVLDKFWEDYTLKQIRDYIKQIDSKNIDNEVTNDLSKTDNSQVTDVDVSVTDISADSTSASTSAI
jgi:uncharacterized protein YjgD (DUF1641 family)